MINVTNCHSSYHHFVLPCYKQHPRYSIIVRNLLVHIHTQNRSPLRSGIGHLDETHRHIVEDHCRNPRNFNTLNTIDTQAYIDNPFCGDDVLVQLKLDNNTLAQVCVQGRGCAICQASASIMAELIEGTQTTQASILSDQIRKMLSTDQRLSETESDSIGDAIALQGVRNFPIRVKCALLPWATLEEALKNHQKQP